MKKEQKVNRNRRPLSIIDKSAFVCLVVLVIYLGIALPIHYQYSVFSWHWFIFGLVALTIPFAFINFQVMRQKKMSFSEGQKKNASIDTIKYIIYFWLLDCFYMAIFNQWTVWIYIIGIITLIKVFYSLTVAFLGKRQRNVLMDISLLFDFLLGVGLTIYLIYLIPDKFINLQTIITSIIAAIYGGLLTLVGVAWTIRKGEEDRKADRLQVEADRKEEERKRVMPYLKYSARLPNEGSVVKSFDWEVNRERIEIDDDRVQKNTKRISKLFGIAIDSFCVKNIAENIVVFIGIRVNGEFYRLVGDLVAESEEVTFFDLRTSFAIDSLNPITQLEIICSDILGNQYSFDCKITIAKQYIDVRNKGKFTLGVPCLLYGIEEIGLPKLEKTQEN